MSIDRASLRQLLSALGSLRPTPPSSPDHEPELPPAAPALYRLAYVAIGDPDSAGALVADTFAALARRGVALAQIDELEALPELIRRLPSGWLSWPGAAGPSEWLRMDLRREQADRLLSSLGERDPIERIGLALCLLWDVRFADLDLWLHDDRLSNQIGEYMAYIGAWLELIPPDDGRHCPNSSADLLDMHDPALGRNLRMHTIGCESCRRRADGLRRTRAVLREALRAFFRAPMPANLARQIEERRRQPRVSPQIKRRIAIGLVVAVLLLGLRARLSLPPEPTTAAAAETVTAAQVIDRAINRFERGIPPDRLLHERVRFRSEGQMLTLERWVGSPSVPRLRITVRAPDRAEPLLDLATDGVHDLAYTASGGWLSPVSVHDREADVQALLPILRQLPFGGSLSDSAIDQRALDLTLLNALRYRNPTLLGLISRNGRPAYTLTGTTEIGDRLFLTIDRATGTLLDARMLTPGESSPRTVWTTDLLEIQPRQDVPLSTFLLDLPAQANVPINPRQLSLPDRALLSIDQAAQTGVLAIPSALPEKPTLAYLRPQRRATPSIVQRYESPWSTLVVIAPISSTPDSSPQGFLPLDRRFGHGNYALIDRQLPQSTLIQFTLDDAPSLRMGLYLWHGRASDDERESLVRNILESMVLIDPSRVQPYRDRFIVPPELPTNFTITHETLLR